MRSDLALIDPASRRDRTEFRWPLVARPAFGGMRPSAVALVSHAAAGLVRRRRVVADARNVRHGRVDGTRRRTSRPITAMVRRRSGGARVLIGGRNLAGPNDPAAHFTVSIDGVAVPGMGRAAGFLPEDLRHSGRPAGGAGHWATLTVQSTPSGSDDPDRDRAVRSAGRAVDDVGLRRGLAGSGIQHGARRLALDERSCDPAHCRPAARSPHHAERSNRRCATSTRRPWCARVPAIGKSRPRPSPTRANGRLTCRRTRSRPRVEQSRLRPIRHLSLRSEAVRPTGDDLGLRVFAIQCL